MKYTLSVSSSSWTLEKWYDERCILVDFLLLLNHLISFCSYMTSSWFFCCSKSRRENEGIKSLRGDDELLLRCRDSSSHFLCKKKEYPVDTLRVSLSFLQVFCFRLVSWFLTTKSVVSTRCVLLVSSRSNVFSPGKKRERFWLCVSQWKEEESLLCFRLWLRKFIIICSWDFALL